MYSFEGEFRRRPQQSFGGASRKLERKELINRAALERQQREDRRRKNQAAVTIQAFYKGVRIRRLEQIKQRSSFDDIVARFDISASGNDPNVVASIIGKFLFFYSENKDQQRILWVTQMLIKISAHVVEWVIRWTECWLYKLQKLLLLNVNYLQNAVSSSASISSSLRFVEIFTFQGSYMCNSQDKEFENKSVEILNKVWNFLIRNGYFSSLKVVLNNRVPDSLITSADPPTPLAESLLSLLLRPMLVTSAHQPFYFRTLLEEIFTAKFSPQIYSFLLPAIANQSNIISVDCVLTAISQNSQLPDITASPYLFYTVMLIMSRQTASLSEAHVVQYVHVLAKILNSSWNEMNEHGRNSDSGSEDDDDSYMQSISKESVEIVKEGIQLMNRPEHVNILVNILDKEQTFEQCAVPISYVCCRLLDYDSLAIHNYRLLYTLAFKPTFLRLLWKSITRTCTPSVFGPSAPLLQYISQGIPLSSSDQESFLPQLIIFCAFLNHLLPTLHDFEFYGDETIAKSNTNMMPFSLSEMTGISLTLRDVCMGLIDLAYPETRHTFNDDYVNAMKSVGSKTFGRHVTISEVKRWNQLFKVAVILLRQLYSRDCRRKFCPDGQWIAKQFVISYQRAADLHFSNRRRYGYEPFIGLQHFTREQLEEEGPPPTAMEVRQLAVLRELPFVIHFHDRVKIFQSLIMKDRERNQGELSNFQLGPQIHVMIRRNFIYEDAFDKLSPENEPNLKLRMRVQLINAVGLDEAGIDGGGIFREFLNELLKTCFDPNRGFFKTTHDRLLYPNPGVHILLPDFNSHYYFIGRMLGKAIYENMLVELPFAGFFLSKILAQQSPDLDIHHLQSLDPVIYKNLLYLKTYDGDISDLGLDFTVMSSELGENEIIELQPGGSNIPVTENNRITYIHLMADYKLNKQIKSQCQAFKEGLANVIDLEWLYMFDPNELQILISGAHVPIDIEDLKTHTNYAGGFSLEHPVIQAFWRVVQGFNERQRRQLLKFVTSCSRPPLLGFKELTPAFCIQNAGSEPDRLPTASTCMNLLKLPEFQDEKTLRSKLLYAVESGAGFELS